VGTVIHQLIQFTAWLILGLMVAILTDWMLLATLYRDGRATHSQQVLTTELAYLQTDLKESFITPAPLDFAVQVANRFHQMLFLQSKLLATLNAAKVAQADQKQGHLKDTHTFIRIIRQVLVNVETYLLSAIVSTQVFALLLAVLILAVPVFALAGTIGLVEGMLQRDINRWRGGRELGQRYHLAKSAVTPALADSPLRHCPAIRGGLRSGLGAGRGHVQEIFLKKGKPDLTALAAG
jgi:integrating conjugative element membrane protein (TIGR03747 family)